MADTGGRPPLPDYEYRGKELGLRPWQARVYFDEARFRLLVCGRRSGKTFELLHELVRAAQVMPYDSRQGRLILYVAPTIKMAQQLIWQPLKACIPKEMIAKKNENSMTMTLRGYNSTIMLFGSENADAMRGLGPDFVAFDEYQHIHPDVWPLIIRPALASNQGEAIFAGTPLGGQGGFYDLFVLANSPDEPDWSGFHITTLESGNVPESEIEAARRTMSPQQFQQEFEATFLKPEGQIYTNFDRKTHIRADLEDPGGTLLVGMDFNVDPMTSLVGARVGTELHILHEYEIMNSHTAEMAERIAADFPDREVVVYPDPSGKSRRTSSNGATDFSILKDYGFQVSAPPKAPAVRDRINTVQAALMNADGVSRVFIHPRCVSLIKSLEGLTYQKGTNQPDKSSGLDHIIDGFGYLICQELPLRKRGLMIGSTIGA